MAKPLTKPTFSEFVDRANKLLAIFEEQIANNQQVVKRKVLMERLCPNCTYPIFLRTLQFLIKHKKIKRISSQNIPENGRYIQMGFSYIYELI